jgi:hypothetical protein
MVQPQRAFGIQDIPSEKRALVVAKPSNPPLPTGDTDLRLAAEKAWQTIVTAMGDSNYSVDDAVNAANVELWVAYKCELESE